MNWVLNSDRVGEISFRDWQLGNGFQTLRWRDGTIRLYVAINYMLAALLQVLQQRTFNNSGFSVEW